jgi:glycolate oxidase FAD binding subunit
VTGGPGCNRVGRHHDGAAGKHAVQRVAAEQGRRIVEHHEVEECCRAHHSFVAHGQHPGFTAGGHIGRAQQFQEHAPVVAKVDITDLDGGDPDVYPVDELIPTHAVKPGTVEELSEIMRSARAEGLSVIPWGSGSQMGVGNVPDGYDVAIDLSEINEVLRYDADDMTMSVQAGCRLDDLNQMLGEHRQVLPVDVAQPERATIGGVTAVGASGPRRLGYGPLRDLIIGISVMSVDGVVAKAGGQVVKNVTGFDMMRLHHGALGSLGIIVSVNLKVIPKPQSERTVFATFRDLEQADQAAREVLQSQLGVTALVVTNPAASAIAD